MKRHITEKELIKYQFKLVSDIRAEQISEHLKSCSDCRELAKQLKQKFSTLDLLREETIVPDKLIKETVKQAKKPVQQRFISFRKSTGLGAIAAVLLLGIALLMSSLVGDKKQEREIAKNLIVSDSETGLDEGTQTTRNLLLDSREPAERKIADSRLRAKRPASERITKEVIPDKPPFAPASAIELVTLPRRENVQITIYNSADLTLVRERRNLTLKKGWNWLQFMWANTLIDPTSLVLEPLEQTDKIDIQQLVFPARLKEIGRWLIRSETSGKVPFEITYFTSGLSWRAFYMGTLTEDEKRMCLEGYVRVSNNSGEDYENAQTRLIVGKVHILDRIAELARRQYPYNRPGWLLSDERSESVAGGKFLKDKGLELNGKLFDMELGMLEPKEIKKEGLSEYFLYTIEGRETIPQSWSKRLISFTADDIEVNSLYKYDEERWGSQAIRFMAFANDKKHNLGETPIPNGDVKIYGQTGEQGYLSYVGGTNVKYIPVDEEIELNLGAAREVIVEPVLMNLEKENFTFDSNNNITGWDEVRTWKIDVTNTRQLPVDIEITRGFETSYWTLEMKGQDVSYEKHDATHSRFKTKLGPRSKRSFEYTIRIYHGKREETGTNIKLQKNIFREIKNER